MAAETAHIKLTRPQVFLLRMLVFLALVGLVSAILYEQILTAFFANAALNGLIIFTLFIGIAYAFRQIIRIYPEIKWVNNFRIADPGLNVAKPPVLLAPMATMLRDRKGHVSLSTLSMRSILDSIGLRLDEARDISRYLVGLLIFLGLLGTFWGLLETITSVGDTISALNTQGNDSLVVFEELKARIGGPAERHGDGVSSSLFGLAGSLVLGFLDLQASQAQNRFYNELEDWLSGITELQAGETLSSGASPQLRLQLIDMQRSIVELGTRIEMGALNDNSTEAVKDLASGIENLIDPDARGAEVVREWADEQAQQQQELANVLKAITDKAKLAPRIAPKGKSK